MKNNVICFVAGKSGGHIIPCLTIAQQYKNSHNFTKIVFFSSNTPIDNTILSHHPLIDFHKKLPLSERGRNPFHIIKAIIQAACSLIMSLYYLYHYRPSTIISTGGIVAIPSCLAAYILRIPITLYCLDALPGKAIRILAPCAQTIYICFKTAYKYFPQHKSFFIQYPIKYTEIAKKDEQKIKKELHLSPDKKTILILGGSQGSLFLNNIIKEFINSSYCNANTTNIIHQTGSLDSTDWQQWYASRNITAHVFSYFPDLSLMYQAADVIICRAGAGTLFEIQFFKKKCIVIPLSTHTTDHQIHNAYAINADYPHLFTYLMQDMIEDNPSILFSLINNKLYKKE